MPERPLDAERVAALIDGRLSPEERERVLAQLADDPDWRDVMIDVAASRKEPSATEPASSLDQPAGITLRPTLLASPARTSTGSSTFLRIAPLATLASAAAVAIIVFGGGDARRDELALRRIGEQAQRLSLTTDELVDLTENRWSVVRSSTESLSPTARSVRLGALAADAMLEVGRTDVGALEGMAQLLRPVSGAGPAIRLLTPALQADELEATLTAARSLVNAELFDAGLWLELVRAGSPVALADSLALRRVRDLAATLAMSPERVAELARHLDALTRAAEEGDAMRARVQATAALALLAS